MDLGAPGPYFGIPWLNFAGWWVVAFVIFGVGYAWTGLNRADERRLPLRYDLAWGLAQVALLVLLGFGAFHRLGSAWPLLLTLAALTPVSMGWFNDLYWRVTVPAHSPRGMASLDRRQGRRVKLRDMDTHGELDLAAALAVAAAAVTEAGRVLLELRRKPIEVLSEVAHDIKLKADQLAEERILRMLKERMPLPVLTEESGEHGGVEETARMWVVDPLDGTFNYSRGMPLCCSSVGLWADGQPVLGAIYNFFSDELFTGIVGQGAWLNGQPIAVSGVREAAKASLATGFPHQQD